MGCWRSAAEQYDIYPSAETDTQKETGGNYDEVRPLRRHTGMIDGIYNLEIKFGEEHVQGVAKVKGNSIKGLDSDRVYVVEFSGQHGKSCWRFSASRYTEPTTGLTTSGSHQITCRQNPSCAARQTKCSAGGLTKSIRHGISFNTAKSG